MPVKNCFTFNGTEWKPMVDMNELHCAFGHNTQSVYIEGLGWWAAGKDMLMIRKIVSQ